MALQQLLWENIVSSIRQDVVGSISLFYGRGFSLFYKIQLVLQKQVKLGFTRACRCIEGLGKKWLKTR